MASNYSPQCFTMVAKYWRVNISRLIANMELPCPGVWCFLYIKIEENKIVGLR